MPVPLAIAGTAAATIGRGGGKVRSGIPNDLQPTRQRNIALLNYLLGYGGADGADPSGYKNGHFQSPDAGTITQRLGGFFGPLGVPQSGLQQQSTDAIGHFLDSPGAENQAYTALAGILGQKPGQGIIDALKPSFDRNLASANQAGGRFSSGNEILRGNAVNDFNLLGAQAAQQGIQQQLAAAQAVDMLRQGQFNRLQGAYQTGTAQAGQADVETQRRLQILLQLLGTSQSASLGGAAQQTPSAGQTLGAGASNLASLLAALAGGGAKAG